MRRVMLTVPPAPGSIRGSVPAARTPCPDWPAPARSTRPSPVRCPAPGRAPRRGTGAQACGQLVERQRRAVPGAGECALAGSANVPNSARSPPLQKDGPLPDSTTSSMDGSRRATSSASSSAARASVENALCRCGRLNRTCRVSPSARQAPVGDVRHPGRSALGEPAGELRARLQCRIRQRFGDDAGQRGSGGVDGRAARRRRRQRPAATACTAR